MTDPRMTSTNNAPVTVEETLRWYAEMTEQTLGSSETGRRALEHDGGLRAYACLAALASAPAELPDMPEYAPDDISHLEGLALYLDGYARGKGRAGLPASKGLFEEIAKRLREYDALRASAPAGDGVEAERLIREAASLIKPGEGEAVFYIRVGGEHTQMQVKAAKGVEPADVIDKAIACLIGEKDDLAGCPAHSTAFGLDVVVDPALPADTVRLSSEALARPHSAVAPAGDGVEDGWRSVPIEPTREMIEAGCFVDIEIYPTNIPSGLTAPNEKEARAIWSAMLAAAPAALARPRATVGEREA